METIKCITFDKKAQDSLPEHVKAKMKADREKATNPEITCGICENTHVRTAITYHGIKVCHSCMEFLKKQSEALFENHPSCKDVKSEETIEELTAKLERYKRGDFS